MEELAQVIEQLWLRYEQFSKLEWRKSAAGQYDSLWRKLSKKAAYFKNKAMVAEEAFFQIYGIRLS